MKRFIRTLFLFGAVYGVAAYGADKDDPPDEDDVEAILEELGPPHSGKRTKVDEVGTVEVDDGDSTKYYYVYNVYVKDRDLDIEEFRAAIFDEAKHYLGYYPTYDLEASEVEEGAFVIPGVYDDETGDSAPFVVQIPPAGPQKMVNINGVGTRFVDAPKPEKKEGDDVRKDNANRPRYREWTLSANDKSISVSALYVKVEGDEVFLKSEAKGIVKGFKLYLLSREDKEYVKDRMDMEDEE